MDRKQFTFYESFASALSRIKSKAARCDAYDAICQFALYGKEPDLDSLPDSAAIAFELIRPTLETSKRKAEIGKLGGSAEAKAKQSASKEQASSKQTASKPEANGKRGEDAREKENEKENEGEIEIENECYKRVPARRFAPPSVDEVANYCRERMNSVDPERFVSFYESNGWKVGKNPMKDWRAAVRTWERDSKPVQKKTTMTTFYDVAQKMKQEGLV